MSGKEEAATAERVYPFNKPPTGIQKPPGYNPNPNGAAGGGATTKAQMYRPALPAYTPQRRRRPRSKRNLCCLCFIWTSIAVLSLLLVLGLAGILVYFIYKPQEPQFSVRSLQIPRLDVTTSKSGDTHLTSEVVLHLAAKNPNSKITFFYEESKATVSTSDGDTSFGDGTFPGFVNGKKNTTVLKFDIKPKGLGIDGAAGKSLSSDYVKRKLFLKVELDTHVSAKIDKWKTGKIKLIVECDGVPVQKSVSASESTDTKCKLKLFKWFPFKPFK